MIHLYRNMNTVKLAGDMQDLATILQQWKEKVEMLMGKKTRYMKV